ncbi:hypothetical protein GYH30_036147 [Glycine max]|nr:hypothetical protein GYH30_036147 [Glycine max]
MDAFDFANVCRKVIFNTRNASITPPTNPLHPPCLTPKDVIPPANKNKKKMGQKENEEEAQPPKRLQQQTLHHFSHSLPSSLKALPMVHHKFKILEATKFDILKDVHQGVLMSINGIPKKTPCSSQPPTPPIDTLLANVDFGEDEGI